MTEVMIDLETLSVRPHAVILIIGAIKFNRDEVWDAKKTYKDLNPKNVFYERITIPSCENVGLHTDKETKKWWSEQEEKVQFEAIHNPDRITLPEALRRFKSWFRGSYKVWGHGSSFDISILGEAYVRCGMTIPWKFWLVRDTRTLFDLGDIRMSDLPDNGKHHALHDCYRQIIGLQMSLKNLKYY